MTSPVVVDGRVTREKLEELLRLGAEHTELEFKSFLDLSVSKHSLNLFKTLIGMANAGSGGYVIVGANDDGSAARSSEPVDVNAFDSAKLAQSIARHVVTAPVITAQHHDVDGWTMVLVHVAPAANHLPCIISKPGEYDDPGKKGMEAVLKQGVIYIREGTRTEAASEGNWPALLSRYRANVLAESRQDIDALIRVVVERLGATADGRAALPPLALELEDGTFVESVDAYLGSKKGKVKLRCFLKSSRTAVAASNPDQFARDLALTKFAYVAIRAVEYSSPQVFAEVIDIVHDEYVAAASRTDIPPAGGRAAYFLAVALRLLAVGAYLVRVKAWWAVAPLVDRAVDDHHLVWLRHAITYAARADLLSSGGRGDALLLVQARALIVTHPELRADLGPVRPVVAGEEFLANDDALNSLCQFDFLWCVVAKLEHPEDPDDSLFYPSCAALYQTRTQPMILRLAVSEDLRIKVSRERSADEWAVALGAVLSFATTQLHNRWWDGAASDQRIARFVGAGQ